MSNYQNLSGILAELQELLNKSSELNNVNLNLLSKFSEDGNGNLLYDNRPVSLGDAEVPPELPLLTNLRAIEQGTDFVQIGFSFPRPVSVQKAVVLVNNQEVGEVSPYAVQHRINALNSDTTYDVSIIVTDLQGNRHEWGITIHTQGEYTPSPEPIIVDNFLYAVEANYITVGWYIPQKERVTKLRILLDGVEHAVLTDYTQETYTVEGLTPDTLYNITVEATDQNGYVDTPYQAVRTKKASTTSDVPDISTGFIQVMERGTDYLVISFGGFKNATKVKIAVNNSEYQVVEEVETSGLWINGLAPDTTYDIKVYAGNDAGYANPLGLEIDTNPVPEAQVPNIQNAEFHAMTRDEQTIDLGWLGFENVKYFDLLVDDTYRITIDGTETSHTFTGLDAATEYKFTIIARNDVGSANPIFAITSTLSA